MLYRPVLLLSIVIVALSASAQMNRPDDPASALFSRASLTGYVHDTSDHPINGAHVEVLNPTTGNAVADAYTISNGSFEIDNIPRGIYEIVATSGVSESRSRMNIDAGNEVSFRLSTSTSAGGQESVSVSQMNVPGKARQLLQKAEQAFRKARLDDAFAFVQKALVCYPNYAKALTLRGILWMQKGDNKDAQPDLEKAVQLDYGDDLGYIALASLYNNEGQFDHAEQTLDHGMPLHPNSWQANLEMARAELGKGDFHGAMRNLDQAQLFAPPTVTLPHLFRAQALIGIRDYQGAISELETYLNKSPNEVNSEQARNTLVKLKEFTASAQK